jgi:hypothetical protein
MDKTEFIQLHDFEAAQEENVDDILANAHSAHQSQQAETAQAAADAADDDFLANLGL